MKIQVIDYGLFDPDGCGWLAIYNLTNYSSKATVVEVEVRNSSGQLKKTLTIPIGPFAQHILDVSPYLDSNDDFGRHSLLIKGGNDLFVRQFFSNDKGGFGMAQGQLHSGELKN